VLAVLFCLELLCGLSCMATCCCYGAASHPAPCSLLPGLRTCLLAALQKQYLIAGGGSPEMELSYQLSQWAKTLVVRACLPAACV
jgi:hypothetical protein